MSDYLRSRIEIAHEYIKGTNKRVHDIECDIEAGRTRLEIGRSMQAGIMSAALEHLEWSMQVAMASWDGAIEEQARQYAEEQTATARDVAMERAGGWE